MTNIKKNRETIPNKNDVIERGFHPAKPEKPLKNPPKSLLVITEPNKPTKPIKDK